ncbi:hypothetical protein [Streptomyces sp. NPDC000410]|uniref:hypothetical protein n=1 Tax=Streptomyces sp. NPDC000410 TaxID=3154254 RepID=UPI0033196824
MPLPPMRLWVTAAAIGHLVRAGLLVCLGGEVEFPDVHPEQVAALARRRDLPALLDRHVPLGPDQAAVRLGVPGGAGRRCRGGPGRARRDGRPGLHVRVQYPGH